jgi:hypothetical protein
LDFHRGRGNLRYSLFWDVTQSNIPQERRFHLHRGGSLKSRKVRTLLKN